MTYTTINDIRALSKITESDISDDDMTIIIRNSVAEINSSINTRVYREQVSEINSVRSNAIDGTNTVFYTQNWDKFMGDLTGDGEVSEDDIIVYKVLDDVETIVPADSVTYDSGKITLATAPEADSELYFTYVYTRIDPVLPDSMLSLAATYLAISYAYLKKDAGVPSIVKFSSISIGRKLSESYGVYYDKYKLIKNELNSKMSLAGGAWVESNIKI